MKARYQKPEIRKIRLVPSEAVLQACKTTGVVGPGGSGCIGNFVCSVSGS